MDDTRRADQTSNDNSEGIRHEIVILGLSFDKKTTSMQSTGLSLAPIPYTTGGQPYEQCENTQVPTLEANEKKITWRRLETFRIRNAVENDYSAVCIRLQFWLCLPNRSQQNAKPQQCKLRDRSKVWQADEWQWHMARNTRMLQEPPLISTSLPSPPTTSPIFLFAVPMPPLLPFSSFPNSTISHSTFVRPSALTPPPCLVLLILPIWLPSSKSRNQGSPRIADPSSCPARSRERDSGSSPSSADWGNNPSSPNSLKSSPSKLPRVTLRNSLSSLGCSLQ